MRNILIAAVAGVALTSCQTQSSEPSAVIEVAGDYRAIADCFFLKNRGFGYWSKDDLDSMKSSHVRLGTTQIEAGRVEFTEIAAGRTRVTFLIPHPQNHEPNVRACATAA